jgi:hypothetical protein
MAGNINNNNGYGYKKYNLYSGNMPIDNNHQTGGTNKNNAFLRQATPKNKYGDRYVGDTGDTYSSSTLSGNKAVTVYRREPYYAMSASSWRKNFPENYETNSSSHKKSSIQEWVPPTQKEDDEISETTRKAHHDIEVFLAAKSVKDVLAKHGL